MISKKINTNNSDNDLLTKNQNNLMNMSTETSSMRNGNNSNIHNKSSKYSTNALFLTCLTDRKFSHNPANFYS